MSKTPKIVTSINHHLWTDALHGRALAHQANNKWDRGTYVRWAVNSAWTCFENVCCEVLSVNSLGMRFTDKLKEALMNLSLPPLDLGQGLWQQVLKVYEVRINYTHTIQEVHLFPEASSADEAIAILREAILYISNHAGAVPPEWVIDDEDRGWDSKDDSRANLTVIRKGVEVGNPNNITIAYVHKDREFESEILPPHTDYELHVETLLNNVRVPISEVRVYKGEILLEKRVIPMRGT